MMTAPGRSRLLKAGQVAARANALQAEAAEAAELELRASLQDAYARGVADGRRAAEEESAAAALRAAAALEQVASDCARLSAEQVDVTEQEIFAAVLELTRWVLRAEPSQASRSLLDRLSQAARTLAPAPTSVVRVSAADREAVQGWARSGVEVITDPRLAPGEARLDRGDGSAILTFSAALRRAAETFGFDPEQFSPAPPPSAVVPGVDPAVDAPEQVVPEQGAPRHAA
jgi:flagellar biosynthesis/type III secretory pathway protein FliH